MPCWLSHKTIYSKFQKFWKTVWKSLKISCFFFVCVIANFENSVIYGIRHNTSLTRFKGNYRNRWHELASRIAIVSKQIFSYQTFEPYEPSILAPWYSFFFLLRYICSTKMTHHKIELDHLNSVVTVDNNTLFWP